MIFNISLLQVIIPSHGEDAVEGITANPSILPPHGYQETACIHGNNSFETERLLLQSL